jgi:hypothetical protein
MRDARFTKTGIEFDGYPFSAASVFPRGVAPYTNVRDVDPRAAPPEIRLESGETLFISATQRHALEEAIAQHGLEVVRRTDVWALLLEPYLDTEFSPEDQERTMELLESAGVSREEVESIRRRVGFRVRCYNAVQWDWTHLGLYDLLEAYQGPVARVFRALGRPSQRRLYEFAMEIAERGRRTGDQRRAG